MYFYDYYCTSDYGDEILNISDSSWPLSFIPLGPGATFTPTTTTMAPTTPKKKKKKKFTGVTAPGAPSAMMLGYDGDVPPLVWDDDDDDLPPPPMGVVHIPEAPPVIHWGWTRGAGQGHGC